MTKQIDKTIRHLKESLKELNSIKIDDYYIKGDIKSFIETTRFNKFLGDSINNIEILIENLEAKYRELHNPITKEKSDNRKL